MSFVSDLIVRLRGDKSQLESTLKGAEGSMNSFGSVVKKIGGILGVAFGIHALVEFSKSAMEAAAAAEGVKNAFAKIGDNNTLSKLQEATRGVVGNTDLMKLAIKSSYFKIPLDDLAKYLEFATKRAIQTGKSVTDLSEAIVVGIGRKSSRSMIQLGLSAKDVQAAFQTTGGLMKMVTEETQKMGDVADTASERYEKLTVKMNALKKAYGEWLNQSAVVSKGTSVLTDVFTMLGDSSLSWGQKLGAFNGVLRQQYIDRKRDIDDFKKDDNSATIVASTEKQIETLNTLNATLKDYKDELNDADITDKAYIADLNTKINRTEAYIKKLTELSTAINRVSTEQLNTLPQNNKPSSVFGKKTYGVSTPLSQQLTGGPSGLGTFAGINMDQSIADAMANQIDADAMLKNMEDLRDRLDSVLSDMRDAAVDYGADIAEALGEALGGGDTKEIGKGLLLSLASFLSQFGKMLIVAGLGLEAFTKSMATGNGIGAIVAGAAMLVAAGAIRGMMSKGSQSGALGSSGAASGNFNPQTIRIEGKLRGKDIYFSQQRYVEDKG